MTVTIKGQEWQFRYCWGAVYAYEELTPRKFDLSKALDRHVMYFAMLGYGNPDRWTMGWEEFEALLDEQPELSGRLDTAFLEELEARTRRSQQGKEEQKKSPEAPA